MRQLHVLGVSEDGATLLLGATKNATKPSHRIPLDDRLRAAARGALVVTGDRAESALSPKEIQARLRAGASVEEVAKAAGVPAARVLPYFAPVEAERDRIVEEARAAVMHRHRGPDGIRQLGLAVDAHLADVAGLKPESVVWSARRRGDGAWVVAVTYAARGGRRKAEWLWQPAGRVVTPLDSAAARLAADAAPTKKRSVARKPAATKAPPKKAPVRKSTAKKAPAPKKAAPKKAVARKAPARPPAVVKKAVVKKSAPPKKVATKNAVAKPPTPKRVAVNKQAAPKKQAAAKRPVAVPKPKPARQPVRKPAAARRPRPVRATPPPTPLPKVAMIPLDEPLDEAIAPTIELAPQPVVAPAPVPVPVPEPEPVAPDPDAPAASARRPGQRVPLPSWSDVLLGVTGNRDDGGSDAPSPGRGGRRAG